MDVTALEIPGAFSITPAQHGDDRGLFLEWFRADLLAEATGHRLATVQANLSRSRRGVVRGVHFAQLPVSQAKYVTCVSGAVLDVVVDVRTGSPTFGRSVAVRLDDADRRAVFLAEGLGHAFVALTDDALVAYLCSSSYEPTREHGVHPLDPALALPWPDDVVPQLSPKDAAAPTLADAEAAGVLPSYEDCLAFYATDAPGGQSARRTSDQ